MPANAGRRALLIGLVAFFSFAYFYSGGGYNQNTRFDLVRAVVERGTLQIDAYQENTGDKAINMAAGIPALCVGLAPAWDRFHNRGKKVLLGLLAVSVLFSLIAVSTPPQPPFEYRSPITQLLWPSFWSGNLALNQTTVLAPSDPDDGGSYGAFNLGHLIGLHRLASLLPLLTLWILAGILWVRMEVRKEIRTPS